jgi:hypothetical protein
VARGACRKPLSISGWGRSDGALWSQAGRSRWQPVANRAPQKTRQTSQSAVATHGNRFRGHGKQGVCRGLQPVRKVSSLRGRGRCLYAAGGYFLFVPRGQGEVPFQPRPGPVQTYSDDVHGCAHDDGDLLRGQALPRRQHQDFPIALG